MDDVRRALRQKVHLVSKWSDRDDAIEWDSRLEEIESSADNLEWTHAATLLERLTRDLDTEGKLVRKQENFLSMYYLNGRFYKISVMQVASKSMMKIENQHKKQSL